MFDHEVHVKRVTHFSSLSRLLLIKKTLSIFLFLVFLQKKERVIVTKELSEHIVSSTASGATTTNEASSESKGGSNSPGDEKKRKRGDDETLTDQLRNSKHVAASVPLENGQVWSPNLSVGSICSSPTKDYCTNGKSDSIGKDTPESQVSQLRRYALLKLPIKKQRSLKTVLILKIKLLSEF